jgi:hypothetical protein
MFASQSLTEHILRGLGGFLLLVLAVWFAPTFWGALLLVPLGLVFLRGCPMCWTVGLVETLWNTMRRRDGQTPVEFCSSCALDQGERNHGA